MIGNHTQAYTACLYHVTTTFCRKLWFYLCLSYSIYGWKVHGVSCVVRLQVCIGT